jgi:hypothetical protein
MTNKNGRRLRVLYLEDNKKEYDDYEPRIKKILAPLAASVDVEWAATRLELDGKMASRPHVVFCDN